MLSVDDRRPCNTDKSSVISHNKALKNKKESLSYVLILIFAGHDAASLRQQLPCLGLVNQENNNGLKDILHRQG